MQVEIVTHANRALHAEALVAMHQGRHQVFVEELGWSDLASSEGVERDGFDDENAVYLIAHEQGEVTGSLRLLPTWRRSMIGELWPQFVQRRSGLGEPGVWEWTRWCPGSARSPRRLWRTRTALILAGLEFAEDRGVREFVTFCEVRFQAQIEELGWRPESLGPPGPAGGGEAIALGWAVRPALLQQARMRLRRPERVSVERAGSAGERPPPERRIGPVGAPA